MTNSLNNEISICGIQCLISIINSQTFFDNIPDFILDCFEFLTKLLENNNNLNYINDFLISFWNLYDDNLTENAKKKLIKFRYSLITNYFS